METSAYLICFVAGVVCCVLVNWALSLGEKGEKRGPLVATPTLFGPGRNAGDVLFALEQYERLSAWDALEGLTPSAASKEVWRLAASGDPDLALWLMAGIALKHDDPTVLGDTFMRVVRITESREKVAKSLAGAIASDLVDRVTRETVKEVSPCSRAL